MININPKVWPIGITLSILAVAGMCVWTVKVAQSAPVEYDNSFFDTYQNVDYNMNKMLTLQNEFNKKYSVNIERKDFIIGQNSVELKVTDKEENPINNAKIDVVITRPFTTRSDKKLKVISSKNGLYKFEPFEIKDLGRWQIQSKTTIDNLIAYNKLEVNATK